MPLFCLPSLTLPTFFLPATMRLSFIAISFVIVTVILTGCQSTNDNTNTQRKTLADLAREQENIEIEGMRLSQKQRATKLAQLYQTILTLEPDTEVRAQIEYRLVQMNTQAFELMDGEELTDVQALNKSEQALAELIISYQDLITRFPKRSDNEWMQYQLAKALDLQGESKESLRQMEVLLAKYPHSQYAAELHFRRGDIYYNFQEYPKALNAYKAARTADNNENYYVNSRYMSAWVLFKLNRLPEADIEFIGLLDYLVAQENQSFSHRNFSFEQLNPRYGSLLSDVQRVLSISLSQQQQAKSLVTLTKQQKSLPQLKFYHHILFKNLAEFLISNELKYDAELTYQSYIALEPTSIWAARYSLALLELQQQQGKYSAARALKKSYVRQFGLDSRFWQETQGKTRTQELAKNEAVQEVLPNLIRFSYQHSRRLYANAQKIKSTNKRKKAFSKTAQSFATYLALVRLPQANYQINKPKLSQSILADEMLYADANFEAQQYQQALTSYQKIAYNNELVFSLEDIVATKPLTFGKGSGEGVNKIDSKDINVANQSNTLASAQANIRLEAAYATTLTTRAMLKQANVKTTSTLHSKGINEQQKLLLLTRNQLDQIFVASYPEDDRVLTLATKAAQYAYLAKDHQSIKNYSDFILQSHLADFYSQSLMIEPSSVADSSTEAFNTKPSKVTSLTKPPALTKKALKQVQIVSQLSANSLYQQKQYIDAERAYQLALMFVTTNTNKQKKKYAEMRELLASCIYFQAQDSVKDQPLLAVHDYLRVGKVVPESSYRLNAEFDAGNILLAQQQWQQGIEVLVAFKKRYPQHEYSRSISAKLAKAYENTGQWPLAAAQLLTMINGPEAAGFSNELKREAQYTAAEYYQKAGNNEKALSTYRTYAHQYPKPFIVAQEVRLKLSNFYRTKKDTNKQYFWYRKIVKYHDIELRKTANSITARAEYLASFAALGLGKAHQQTFTWAKLKLPLNKSLKRKQAAMKLAIEYYQKVLSYQLAEFVPQASFNLATMYGLLANDIMSSERPSDLDELALEEYELLLEDIAIPFEDKAIEIHTNNAQRSWQNVFDTWVERSFNALAELDPAQYNKKERTSDAIQAIY